MEWGGMGGVGTKLIEVIRGDQATESTYIEWNGKMLWDIC